MNSAAPDFVLFVQHGWADDNRAMLALGQALATERTHIVAPNLGYLKTWLRITPLIEIAEQAALATLAQYPNLPWRIVGHSMGGLIWLELLHRQPQWWSRVHSLCLVASPIGGADLGRMFDPLGLGLGIAADLGKSRRAIAQQIAAEIPTLIVAGDIDGGSDGTVTVECTKFCHARFVQLPQRSHPALRNHPEVVAAIQDFWLDTSLGDRLTAQPAIERLRAADWITDGHPRDFARAKPFQTLDDGSTIRLWRNPLGILHVFVADAEGQYLYGGFVGWLHEPELWQLLQTIAAEAAVDSGPLNLG
jgi:pimeloyl-ACP methyl ester carboxylesterase